MSIITESIESPEWRSFCQYSTLRPRGTNFDSDFLLKLFCIVIDSCDLAHEDEILIHIVMRVARPNESR
jgi:hypothetical protein